MDDNGTIIHGCGHTKKKVRTKQFEPQSNWSAEPQRHLHGQNHNEIRFCKLSDGHETNKKRVFSSVPKMKGGDAQSQQDSVFILSEFYEYTVK